MNLVENSMQNGANPMQTVSKQRWIQNKFPKLIKKQILKLFRTNFLAVPFPCGAFFLGNPRSFRRYLILGNFRHRLVRVPTHEMVILGPSLWDLAAGAATDSTLAVPFS